MGTAEGGSVMFARSSGAAAAASVVHRPQLQPRRHNLPPNHCGGGGGPHQCAVPDDPRHHGFFRGGHLVGLQRLQHHLNGNPSGLRWGQGIPHHLHHHPHHHHHHHMVTPPPEPQQHHWYPWAGPKKESGGAAVGGYAGGGGGGGGGGGPQPLGLVGGGAVVGGGGGAPLVGEKPSKEEEEALWSNVEAQAAFLGPNLWDRTLPYDADLKYVDLDEFLSENGIPVEGEVGPGGEPHAVPRATASSTPPHQHQQQHQQTSDATDPGEDSLHRRPPSRSPRPESYDGGDERHYPHPQDDVVKAEHQRGRLLRCSPQPPLTSVSSAASDPDTVALLSGCVAGPPSPAGSDFSMSSSTTTTGHDFDPRTRAFSDEELKPQPMIKKSKKQFVPDDLKDEKYWARRRKNNMAAKRSRDARRVKENQIALRAGFLEKENVNLRQELERLKKENSVLRDRLTKYTEV